MVGPAQLPLCWKNNAILFVHGILFYWDVGSLADVVMLMILNGLQCYIPILCEHASFFFFAGRIATYIKAKTQYNPFLQKGP